MDPQAREQTTGQDTVSDRKVDIRQPILTQFPELLPLASADGVRIPFNWKGRSYNIASYKYDTGGPKDYGIVFGVWDVTEPSHEVPVGVADYFYDGIENQAVLPFSNHFVKEIERIPHDQIPRGFAELNNIRGEGLNFAFSVANDPTYRKTGLSHLLYALSLASLEHRGIDLLFVQTDTTRENVTGSPETFKSHFKDPSLLEPQPYTSFYTRYAGLDGMDFFGRPYIPTHLSGYYISMLQKALKK